MTKQEFEQRMSAKVTDEDFIAANAAYMAAGDDVDKDKFCELYKTKAGLITLVDILTCRITGLRTQMYQKKSTLIEHVTDMLLLANDQNVKFDAVARKMIGWKDYIKIKLDNNLPLSENDKELILLSIK